MFEQLAINQTPIAFPLYSQTYFEEPKTLNIVQEKRQPSTGTTGSQVVVSSVASKSLGTTTVADLSEGRRAVFTRETLVKPTQLDLLEKTRNDRVHLLARKYAGGIDVEGNARLEILTARLDQILPPIEAKTIERVTAILENALRPNRTLESLKTKYKI